MSASTQRRTQANGVALPVVPHSVEAEQAVLGGLLIEPTAWGNVAELLDAGDFYRPDHRIIFASIGALARAGSPFDMLLVSEHLDRLGHLQEAGGLAYLGTLARDTPTAINIASYAGVVRERARLRRLQRLGVDIERAIAEGEGSHAIGTALLGTLERWREQSDPERGLRLELRAFSAGEILATIEPEVFSLPGIPAEAYSLIAGALNSYKTTLLINLLVWKASGWDLLGLDEGGGGVETGRCILLTYEDHDRRVFRRLQRVIQRGHQRITERYGARAGAEFIERVSENLRRITLTGQAGRGIVVRARDAIVPNEALIERLLAELRAFAPGGALIGLDPLRLAIVGSQNDDDGADVAVHALNRIAAALPGSALIVASHTNKSLAAEGVSDYIGAAYATSGSALYSQHARSNFHMGRMRAAEIKETFDPGDVTEKEAARQLVAKLTHGRNSHGTEREPSYFVMRDGVLIRLRPRETKAQSAPQFMRTAAAPIVEAIEALRGEGMKVSATTLQKDPTLVRQLGSRDDVRDAVRLLLENGHLEASGTTRDRTLSVTPSGRVLAGRASPRETQKEGTE
ncbi:MAG TPA: DnaB-like helicase N-terminal domain-containing protein [Steroidobacteraceae bacterium]|nr:DnaB-like helicase N-terminal domain-containing protein [Steroidobacteraceae bacterium]